MIGDQRFKPGVQTGVVELACFDVKVRPEVLPGERRLGPRQQRLGGARADLLQQPLKGVAQVPLATLAVLVTVGVECITRRRRLRSLFVAIARADPIGDGPAGCAHRADTRDGCARDRS
jgi:hypothetical protein